MDISSANDDVSSKIGIVEKMMINPISSHYLSYYNDEKMMDHANLILSSSELFNYF
jgi:hypothetical protein